MEVRKWSHVLQLAKDILNNEKLSAEMQLEVSKIVELEDKFIKDFSKKKGEYLDLEIEKGQLHNIEIDYKICRELFIKKCLIDIYLHYFFVFLSFVWLVLGLPKSIISFFS